MVLIKMAACSLACRPITEGAAETFAGVPWAALLAEAIRFIGEDLRLARAQLAAAKHAGARGPEVDLTGFAIARRFLDHAECAEIMADRQAMSHFGAWAHAALYEFALSCSAKGHPAQARATLETLCRERPKLLPAWRALGDAFMCLGLETESEAAYAKARGKADLPAWQAEIACLCARNLLQDAAGKARLHARDPERSEYALRLLLTIEARRGGLGGVEETASLLAAIMPSFYQAMAAEANALEEESEWAEAFLRNEQLLTLQPLSVPEKLRAARLLTGLGRTQEACVLFHDVSTAHPGSLAASMGYSSALRSLGRQADAVATLRTVIRRFPKSGVPYWALGDLKSGMLTAEDIVAMQGLLRKPDYPRRDAIHLHYALGAAFEHVGQFRDSFTHYRAGAHARRAMQPHDADAHERLVAHMRGAVTSETIARLSGAGYGDPAPIFVVGMPRSGTTLMEQILSSHPDVEGTMELAELGKSIQQVRQLTDSAAQLRSTWIETLSRSAVHDIGARYLARTQPFRCSNRPFFVDKLTANWLHAWLIALALPRAKIINMQRNAMATCFGNFKQLFVEGAQEFSYDLREIGRYFLTYRQTIGHYSSLLPGQIHHCSYEALVDNPEKEIRALLAYCELPFDPACLSFWETSRSVRTVSSEQVRRPIYREALDRWRNFEPWLGPLRAVLASHVNITQHAGRP